MSYHESIENFIKIDEKNTETAGNTHKREDLFDDPKYGDLLCLDLENTDCIQQ